MHRTYCPSFFGSPERGSLSEVEEDARIVEAFVASDLFRWSNCTGFQEGSFGTRAGPYYTVFNLLHEIGHCVQLSDVEVLRAKTSPGGWGLVLRQQHIPGYGTCVDVRTTECSERETEVFGIQLVLGELLFGIDREKYLAHIHELITWLPDYPLIPTESEGMDARRADRDAWIRERVQASRDKWTDPETIRTRLINNLGVLLG